MSTPGCSYSLFAEMSKYQKFQSKHFAKKIQRPKCKYCDSSILAPKLKYFVAKMQHFDTKLQWFELK
jgi:hypothetical protein